MISDIINYILFLKKKFGLSITLHSTTNQEIFANNDLSIFNIHDCSYCIFLKQNDNFYNRCRELQRKVQKKCEISRFSGICHGGIKEYVYPINADEKCVGFVSVGGYKSENSECYINKICDKYGFDKKFLKEKYKSLKNDTVNENMLDSLIMPLCHMIELAYKKDYFIKYEGSNLCQKAMFYINANYMNNINSKILCKVFHCSRSYLSKEFNKFSNMSIRDYITKVRISKSKMLLKHSNMSVGDIAYAVGFQDSNYFSSIFKKVVKKSPLQYKKAK